MRAIIPFGEAVGGPRPAVIRSENKTEIKPEFRLNMSISGTKQHELHYRDNNLKVSMFVITPVLTAGRFGKAKRLFTIDGDDTEYSDRKMFLEALKIARKVLDE